MDPCKRKEANVIDNILLERCIEDQELKGEAGRLARMDKIPMGQIEQIRLEYLNILRIDHLWVMKSLTKLFLNNNHIEKIENLETLIHLVDLDLSFNKITVIENLDELKKLEKLNLCSNKISKMENMDTMKKLQIFSIAQNLIDDLDNILYLRRFPNLKSLNLEGNPLANIDNFHLFVAVFLPQLHYYHYRRIYEEDQQSGIKIFRKKLLDFQREEEKAEILRLEKEKEIADAELYSKCFVEYLNTKHLFNLLFEKDNDGLAFLEFGDEPKELFQEYEEQFVDLCKKIFNTGQDQYNLRQSEIDQFEECVETAQQQNQDESIRHMEEFMVNKTELFTNIKNLQEDLEDDRISYELYIELIEKHSASFNDLVHMTWKDLMKLEMELVDQMEEVNQNFEHALAEQVNVFVESAQGYFSQMRLLEQNYMDNIGEFGLKINTMITIGEPPADIPERLQEIVSDKDALQNCFAASHDMHMQLIDNREDVLVSRIRNWLDDLVENLNKNEIKRNREKVLEINHYLDIQGEEYQELMSYEYGNNVDPDVTAMLGDF